MPCVEATTGEVDIIESPDVGNEPRWPAFSERMLSETPVRSMLSYELFLEADTLGALNLYSDRPNAFADRDRGSGQSFAAHAAIAFQAAQAGERIAHLERALLTSRGIGQAIGVLVSRRVITEDQAFTLLVLTGDLPD